MTITDLVIAGVIGGLFGYFGGLLAMYVKKRSGWGRGEVGKVGDRGDQGKPWR